MRGQKVNENLNPRSIIERTTATEASEKFSFAHVELVAKRQGISLIETVVRKSRPNLRVWVSVLINDLWPLYAKVFIVFPCY